MISQGDHGLYAGHALTKELLLLILPVLLSLYVLTCGAAMITAESEKSIVRRFMDYFRPEQPKLQILQWYSLYQQCNS